MGRTSGGVVTPPGSIATPLPTNTSAQNKAIIDAALAGLLPGATCTINCSHGQFQTLGGHIRPPGVRVTATGGAGRPGLQNCPIQADPAMVAGYLFAGAAWANQTAAPDVGGEFDHLHIDMNGAAAHGIAECGRNFKIHDNEVYNQSGAFSGIVYGGTIGTTGTMNNGKVYNNISQVTAPVATPGQHNLWLTGLGTTPLTDTDTFDNLVNGCGDTEIQIDAGGNNNTYRNHGSTLVADGSSFIYYATMSSAECWDNQMDDTSRANAGGQTNTCIRVGSVTASPANRPSRIFKNKLHADESHGAGAATWNYIQVDSFSDQAYLEVTGNDCNQDAAGAGVSSAYKFTSPAGHTAYVDFKPGQTTGTTPAPLIAGGGTVGLTSGMKVLGADAGLTAGALTAVLTSDPLPPGVYDVTGWTTLSGATSANYFDAWIKGSAAGGATIDRTPGGTARTVASSPSGAVSFGGRIVVSVAGTIDLAVEPVAGMTGVLVSLQHAQAGAGAGVFVTGLKWAKV